MSNAEFMSMLFDQDYVLVKDDFGAHFEYRKTGPEKQDDESLVYVCPWCGSKNYPENLRCIYCGGPQ